MAEAGAARKPGVDTALAIGRPALGVSRFFARAIDAFRLVQPRVITLYASMEARLKAGIWVSMALRLGDIAGPLFVNQCLAGTKNRQPDRSSAL